MKLEITVGEPVMNEVKVLDITFADLDGFYVSASEIDQANLFFILLTPLHYYEDNIDELLTMPCYLIDILPQKVDQDEDGPYFAFEEYYLADKNRLKLFENFADANCKSKLDTSGRTGDIGSSGINTV